MVADAPVELVTRKVGLPPESAPRPVIVKVPLSLPVDRFATVILWPTLRAGPEITE